MTGFEPGSSDVKSEFTSDSALPLNMPAWPVVARDDSNEVLKRVLKLWGLVRWLKYVEIARHWPCTIGRIPIWNTHYNFNFIISPWKSRTTAPEEHQAQVLPDLDLGSTKVTHPTILGGGVPKNFCVVKCLPKCTAEAPEPLWAPFLPPLDPGTRVEGVQPHQVAFRETYYKFDFMNSLQ